MAQAHGGGHQAQQVHHLTYGQRELYRHARERAARRAALWDRAHAIGVRAAMVVGGLGVIAVVLVMLGCLGGCARAARPAITHYTPGTASNSVTTTEHRGGTVSLRAGPAAPAFPAPPAPPSTPDGVLRVRVVPREGGTAAPSAAGK